MKPLTRATQQRFRPMLERIPSYKHEDFSQDRLELYTELKGKKKDNIIPYTVMDLYSIRPDSQDQYHPRCYETTMFVNDLFEKRHIRGNKFYVPLTDSNIELIAHCWPSNQLVLKDEITKTMWYHTLAKGKLQDVGAKVVAEYKNSKRLPPKNGFVEHPERPLMPFQVVARYCASLQDGYAFFMEQGTGKTPVSINTILNTAIESRAEGNDDLHRVLIICPKNVRFNWEVEIGNFCTAPHKVTIISGSSVERQKQLITAIVKQNGEEISFVIASYGALSNTIDAMCLRSFEGLQLKKKLQWDCAILDESHSIKSPSTKRTKASLKLRDASKKRLILTGTPFVNSLYDLWSQFEFTGRYNSGFSNFNAFKEFHSCYEKASQEDADKKVQSFDNIPLLQERLARLSFLITKKEALPDLPEKVYDTVEVDMTKEQLQMYSDVATQLFLEIDATSDSLGKEMKVTNILTKMLRLAQVTSGFLSWDAQYDEDGNCIQEKTIDRLDPNNKLEALVELIKNKAPTDKTLIWACFEQDIKSISARLSLEGFDNVVFYGKTKDKERKDAELRFNCDPTCRFFVGNPAAGGVGLNLLGYDYRQRTDSEDARLTNCNHIIYYSQNWSLTARAQSEDRSHRRGTRQNVRITDLCIPRSIDEEIRKRVVGKIKSAIQLQDIKHILERILHPMKEEK